jgi:hypothetical protein
LGCLGTGDQNPSTESSTANRRSGVNHKHADQDVGPPSNHTGSSFPPALHLALHVGAAQAALTSKAWFDSRGRLRGAQPRTCLQAIGSKVEHLSTKQTVAGSSPVSLPLQHPTSGAPFFPLDVGGHQRRSGRYRGCGSPTCQESRSIQLFPALHLAPHVGAAQQLSQAIGFESRTALQGAQPRCPSQATTAQLDERRPLKPKVAGSSPAPCYHQGFTSGTQPSPP